MTLTTKNLDKSLLYAVVCGMMALLVADSYMLACEY
jgi:hypothetical protein